MNTPRPAAANAPLAGEHVVFTATSPTINRAVFLLRALGATAGDAAGATIVLDEMVPGDVSDAVDPKTGCTVIDNVPTGTAASTSGVLAEAVSGILDVTGEPGGPPCVPGADLAAEVTAAFCAIGALASRYVALSRDEVVSVEIPVFDASIATLSYMAVSYFTDGKVPTRLGTSHPTIYPYNAFAALDGMVVVASFTQRFWRNFCVAVGRTELLEDERFVDFAARLKHKVELSAILEPIMSGRTVDEWVDAMGTADVPCGPVLTLPAAEEYAQTRFRRDQASRDGGYPFVWSVPGATP